MNNNSKQNSSGAKNYDPGSRLRGRVVLTGDLKLESPLIIGSGLEDNADLDVLRDVNGHPYIPGSSLAGVIRSVLKTFFQAGTEEAEAFSEKFQLLGHDKQAKKENTEKNNGHSDYMSAITFADAELKDPGKYRIIVRDSVRIDPKSATAADKGKFDYELVDKGAVFKLRIEGEIRGSAETTALVKRLMLRIKQLFKEEQIRLGAKTNAGFGKVSLDSEKLRYFDFSDGKHVRGWLSWSSDNPESLAAGGCTEIGEADVLGDDVNLEYPKKYFHFKGSFAIRNSLIIRSYDPGEIEPGEDPDAVMLHRGSGDTLEYILPGTSLKGAFRHQALKIWNTYRNDDYDHDSGAEYLNSLNEFTRLFGFVQVKGSGADAEEGQSALKGRVRFEETVLPAAKNPWHKLQQRVKIDRFTGGAVDSALFNSVPVWQPDDKGLVELEITADISDDWEAGLLLLVIKDLWTGYLAVGGEKSIGRGVFQGRTGELEYDGIKATLVEKDGAVELESDDKENTVQKLDELVSAVVKGKEETHE